MDGLEFATMLDEEQMDSLFSEDSSKEEGTEETDENKETDNTAEVNPNNLFGSSESVGSEDNKDGNEDTSSNEDGASPDFFSSIANAFAEEGIFPDLDEEAVKNIKTAADFRKAIDDQIKAGLNEQQQRVISALNNNAEPDKVRQYENVLDYLDSIDEKALSAEGEEGDTLRRRILFQDYINRGFAKERAEKAVTRAFNAGTDIEDAKEALESNKTFYKDEYEQYLQDVEEEAKEEERQLKERTTRIKNTILEGDLKFFGDVDINKTTRQTAYDAISKPVYKDPKTGNTYTAVQKAQLDDEEGFLAKLGLIYALTDGFKSIDGLVKKKVNKEVKKDTNSKQGVIFNI